tara:strand:+ start:88833 stop:89228 length:396 start_codon:yes stop_codon:yes gene_type:complete
MDRIHVIFVYLICAFFFPAHAEEIIVGKVTAEEVHRVFSYNANNAGARDVDDEFFIYANDLSDGLRDGSVAASRTTMNRVCLEYVKYVNIEDSLTADVIETLLFPKLKRQMNPLSGFTYYHKCKNLLEGIR